MPEGKQTVPLKQIAARIAQLVELVGGQGRAAEIAEVSRATVQKWRSAQARPPLIEISRLAAAAGVSVDWVASGIEYNPHTETDEVAWLPLLGEVEGMTVPVPRVALASRMRSVEKAAAVAVVGREMEPFIRSGDIVIIDQGDCDLSRSSGRVYVLKRGSSLNLMRAALLLSGVVQLSTETPQHSERLTPSDLKGVEVVGRVVLALSEP